MPQNFKLKCHFGPYEPGGIVPSHVFVGHDLTRMVETGLVEPTALPPNVELVVPKPTPEVAPDDVLKERNRLAEENQALRAENAKLRGMAAEFEAARDGLRGKCGEYTEAISHLEKACEDHQAALDAAEQRAAVAEAKVAELTAELEAATDPGKPAA